MDYALFAISFTAVWVLLSLVYWSVKNGISPMPTTPPVKRDLLTLLPALPPCQIAELGSGWGTLLIALGKHYPHCQIIGYETSPIPYWVSRLRLKIQPRPNVSVKKRDFLREPLHNFRLIVCYLYPGAMQQLASKLLHELPKDSVVVSNTFALPGWQPDQILIRQDLYRTHLYRYQTGVQK